MRRRASLGIVRRSQAHWRRHKICWFRNLLINQTHIVHWERLLRLGIREMRTHTHITYYGTINKQNESLLAACEWVGRAYVWEINMGIGQTGNAHFKIGHSSHICWPPLRPLNERNQAASSCKIVTFKYRLFGERVNVRSSGPLFVYTVVIENSRRRWPQRISFAIAIIFFSTLKFHCCVRCACWTVSHCLIQKNGSNMNFTIRIN